MVFILIDIEQKISYDVTMENKNINFFVVIPVYNEEKYISRIIQDVKKITNNIVVVDDGSEDNTYFLAKNEMSDNTVILRHKINLGKGAALKTGCEAAIKMGVEAMVLMDGDGQHSSDDILGITNKLMNNDLDIVFGVREMNKKMPFYRLLGNNLLARFAKLLSGVDVGDILCGFRALTGEAYRKINWQSSGYSVETEMIMVVGKHKLKYGTIPIKTIYNDKYKGMTPIDGIKIFIDLIKFKLL